MLLKEGFKTILHLFFFFSKMWLKTETNDMGLEGADSSSLLYIGISLASLIVEEYTLLALIAFVSAHQTVSGNIVSRQGYRVGVSQGTHHV